MDDALLQLLQDALKQTIAFGSLAVSVAKVFRNEATRPPGLVLSLLRSERNIIATLVTDQLETAANAQEDGERNAAPLTEGPSSFMAPSLLEVAEGPVHAAVQHPAGLHTELQGEREDSESG